MSMGLQDEQEKLGALLWLDDEVEDFVGARHKLGDRGVEVLEARTVDEALNAAELFDIRVCLVDLKLKSGRQGVDFIFAAYAKFPKMCFLVYSHYAHLTEPYHRLRSLSQKLSGRLWNLPKDVVPSVTSRSFDKYFTDPIVSLLKKQSPPKETVAQFDKIEKKSFPEISLTKYLTLPVEDRAEIVADFRTRHSATIEELFRQGNAWVLFLGEDETPTRVEKDRRLIPDDAEIGELAFEQRRVPFHFFADSIADDFDSSRCSLETQARGYPTIRIEFKGCTFDTHFDTGLYETRFDYDFCTEVGFIGRINFPGMGVVPGKSEPGTRAVKELLPMSAFHVEASLFKRTTEEAFDILLRGIATVNWKRTSFSRDCYSDCAYYDMENSGERAVRRRSPRTCLFRNGLLGRSLLEDNEKLRIILQHGTTDIDWESGVLIA
jgi:hypothetical protein